MPLANRFLYSPISYLFRGDFKGFLLIVLYLLPALVIALSFHEAAHAWMANRMGDPTAKNLGRMTLDPTKHIALFGLIAFLFIGFGWGKPVPTNPRNYHNFKKANVLVSISGVTVNLILSFLFYMILSVAVALGLQNAIIINILSNIVFLNIILCFFNLIPIPPLDGHHLVSGFIARKSPRFFMYYKQYGYIVLLGLLFLTNWIHFILNFFTFWVIYAYEAFFGLFL